MRLLMRSCVCMLVFWLLGSAQVIAYQQTYKQTKYGKKYFHWKKLPVPFVIERSGSPDLPDKEKTFQVISQSFTTWTEPGCTCFRVSYDGLVSLKRDPTSKELVIPQDSMLNLVMFRTQDWINDSISVALTMTYIDPRTGELKKFETEINNVNFNFQIQGVARTSGQRAFDLQNIMTHEAGHALGLADNDISESTMFASAKKGETKKSALGQDDIAGVCALYNKNPQTGTCSIQTQPNTSIQQPLRVLPAIEGEIGIGCQSSAALGSLWAMLCLFFLAWGGRRLRRLR